MRTLRRSVPDGAKARPKGPDVPTTYGMLAEFDDADKLLGAVNQAREAGYRKMEAYTPFPVHGLDDALGMKMTKLPFLVFLGGLAGAIGGFGLQSYGMAIGYTYNIGGRPLFSWPLWIPITFELMVLSAVVTAVFGMLILNGLPQLYHPVFSAENFASASRDHFFLSVEADDSKYDSAETRRFLESMSPLSVSEVNK